VQKDKECRSECQTQDEKHRTERLEQSEEETARQTIAADLSKEVQMNILALSKIALTTAKDSSATSEENILKGVQIGLNHTAPSKWFEL